MTNLAYKLNFISFVQYSFVNHIIIMDKILFQTLFSSEGFYLEEFVEIIFAKDINFIIIYLII